ncbi:MAG: sigma 54-interacting transcriptional regulator [Thermodesulfobacteriota bacterium]|nr:sigma 54-interacting transcriptional regulator [Thermodesulfobacteriota bacterium]
MNNHVNSFRVMADLRQTGYTNGLGMENSRKNCGAFPDTLLESETFGYKAGVFNKTGREKKGQFALT